MATTQRIPTGETLPFDKLSDELKTKVLDNNRDYDTNDESWYESVIESFKTGLSLLGAEVENIYFNCGYSQSDYCALDKLEYSYEKNAPKKIKAEFGGELGEKLAKYAELLQDIQKPYFYNLEARITQSERGRNNVELYHSEDQYRDIGQAESDVIQVFSEISDDILISLYTELEYRQSDKHLTEVFSESDHTFDNDGDMF